MLKEKTLPNSDNEYSSFLSISSFLIKKLTWSAKSYILWLINQNGKLEDFSKLMKSYLFILSLKFFSLLNMKEIPGII